MIIDHPNGHQYKIDIKDYYNQTITEIDTEKSYTYKEPDFCWADINFDPINCILIVEGCIWACPSELLTKLF